MLTAKQAGMIDLSARSTLPEEMDQPGVSAKETRRALGEIDFINRTLGGYHVVISALERLDRLRDPQKKSVTIMDMGCGGGDTMQAVAKWAQKNNKQVNLIGVDCNPVMTEFAQARSKSHPNITYRTMDVFDPRLKNEKADIIMNSLFCHHFDDPDLVRLVRWMYELSSEAVVINDIDRHWLAYHSIRILTALFSKAYMVRYDAPLSVARALTKSEWQNILAKAGIKSYRMQWMWAWRWQIVFHKKKQNDLG